MIERYENRRVQTPDLFDKGPVITNGFNPEIYFEVLKGNVPVYLARKVMSPLDCRQIVSAFFRSSDRTQYSVEPKIERIGTPLYRAGTEAVLEYFQNAQDCLAMTNSVYAEAGTVNYVEFLLDKIRRYYAERAGTVRSIQHEGFSGFYGILRSWGSTIIKQGQDATPIHEDYVQIRLHEGLETQDVIYNNIGSTCLYFSNGSAGGELVVYDMRISIEDYIFENQKNYGYSDELVQGVKKIVVRPEPGDVITFWSDRLHKVTGIDTGTRVTAAFFSALKQDTKECLIWS